MYLSSGVPCISLQFFFHYASEEGELSIKRPTSEETFNPIEGIKSSYQFFALRQGEVLARLRSCWCVAYVSVAMCGPGSNKLSSQYQVSGCPHSANDDEQARFFEWSNRSCRAITGSSVATREDEVKAKGKALAPTVKVGDWLLVEAYSDSHDEMWLARAVPGFVDAPGENKCLIQHLGRTIHQHGTRFDHGDYKIAVQFYERSPNCDDERRTFVIGEPRVDVINSTELRACGFNMDLLTTARSRPGGDPEHQILVLPRDTEATALRNCR